MRRRTVKMIKFIDSVLHFIMPSRKGSFPVSAVREITIVQLAHIGDLMLMLPALKTLKSISKYKINLLVGSQNYTIASKLKFIDQVFIADAPYFARGKKVSYVNFIRQLKKVSTDLIFDVRGDLRNNFFIKLFVKKRLFAGYEVGGGGSLLDIVLPFKKGGHVSALSTPLFNYLGFPNIDIYKYWQEENMPCEEISGLVLPNEFIVMHVGTGAQARKWPIENFIETIEIIAVDIPVYVLGVPQDLSAEQNDIISSLPNVFNCIGRYSILQSIYIVRKSTLFMGLDSGFSHIASLLKKKVIVVFSGTVDKGVWRPISFYEEQVTLLNEKVACDLVNGCGRLNCPDNICMKKIGPEKVVNAIKLFFANKYAGEF